MRRIFVVRQGRKPPPYWRKARISNAVSRQKDKQISSRDSWDINNHAESHNTLHHSKYVQRDPVQFFVSQLTIRCPNQNKTDEYIVRKHAGREYICCRVFCRQHRRGLIYRRSRQCVHRMGEQWTADLVLQKEFQEPVWKGIITRKTVGTQVGCFFSCIGKRSRHQFDIEQVVVIKISDLPDRLLAVILHPLHRHIEQAPHKIIGRIAWNNISVLLEIPD